MKNRNFINLLLVLLMALWIFPSAIQAIEEVVIPVTQEDAKGMDKDVASLGVNFDAYERDLDDILKIKLMSHPDPEYGVNAIIVDLNRKIAGNPQDVESLVSLGHVYRILGQPSEANRFYEKALMISPDRFHLNVFSAKMNFQQARFQEALARIDAALESNPYDASIWGARAKTSLQLHNESEATFSYEKVLSIDSDNEEALFFLSLLSQKEGKYTEAEKYLEQLSGVAPDNRKVQYHLGSILFAQKKSKEAIQVWEKLFAEGVRSPQFLFNLTLAYLDYGDNSKAEVLLKHLRFFFPREPDVDFLFAEAYRQMGRLDEAENKYLEVITFNPDHVSAYVGLAEVLEAKGKKEESRVLLQQASVKLAQMRNLKNQQGLN